MALAYRLWTVADKARALAKRRGEQPTTTHLVRILAESAPDDFDAAFGDGASTEWVSADLADLASRVGTATPLDEAVASLSATNVRELCGELRSLIDETKASSPEQPATLPATGEKAGPTAGSPGTPSAPQEAVAGESAAAVAPAPPLPRGPELPDKIAQAIEPESKAVKRRAAAKHLMLQEPTPPLASRVDVVAEVLALVTCAMPRLALVIGDSGAGRTTFVRNLAARAAELDPPVEVCAVDVLSILGSDQPMEVLENCLAMPDPGRIIVVDDLEVLLGLVLARPLDAMAMVLQAAARRRGQRLVFVIDTSHLARLEAIAPDLVVRSVHSTLPSLTRDELDGVVQAEAAQLGAFHEVDIPRTLLPLALAAPREKDRRRHPGLAIDRLDLAAARASLRGAAAVADGDIDQDGSFAESALSARGLADRLRESVHGQDDAVTTVARRIALTTVGLDLRPHRPNGVLLFVGPTGVGKTQLARALCASLYGDEGRLIRLDMSEYGDKWAVSRLIGPQPGYIGSDEPSSWLTTRVRQQPRTVVLLDEFEKAHPDVWNTFLQVFDAGRLSDPSGKVADFADAVIVMTSNLGSGAVGSAGLGFGQADEAQVAQRSRDAILSAVRQSLSPELLNRIDDVVVFQPLGRDAVREIARREVGAIIDRLGDRGYRVTLSDGVIEHLAGQGYDPRYGARNLLRVIEKELLLPLIDQEARDVNVSLDGDALVWNANA